MFALVIWYKGSLMNTIRPIIKNIIIGRMDDSNNSQKCQISK